MTDERSTQSARPAHKGLQGLASAGLLAIAIALAAAGCTAVGGGGGPAAEGAPAIHAGPGRPGVLEPAQARAYLAQHPRTWVLDVREPEEWNNELGHIEGSIQIPLGELPARLGELESRKQDPVIVVCRSGRRSGNAVVLLAGSGFREAYNLEGGLLAWREAGY